MQHIEEAGIHSGDSACCLPPVSIKPYLVKEIENQTKKLALALKVKGFMNIQFAIKKDEIYVIEVNPWINFDYINFIFFNRKLNIHETFYFEC